MQLGRSVREIEGAGASKQLPIYRRIRDHFVAKIANGELKSHEQLPAERTLCSEFDISRTTARLALVQLESLGLVYRKGRRGWFVAPDPVHYSLTRTVSFTDTVISQGGKPGTKLLEFETLVASDTIREQLALDEGERVHLVRRLRSINSHPAMVEAFYLPAERYPGLLELDLAPDRSLDDVLAERYGLRPRRGQVSLGLRALPAAYANALEVPEGTIGIYIARVVVDDGGRPIELDEEYWRGDVAEFSVDVELL